MKRCLILAVVTAIFMSICSVASAEVPREILFRGIQWGSHVDDVVPQMENAGFHWIRRSPELQAQQAHAMILHTVGSEMYNHVNNYYVWCNAGTNKPEVYVAGYELECVHLYFTYVPNDDRISVHTPENTSLYFATYVIEPRDLESAYTDLKAKLTSIYGAPNSETTERGIIDKCTICTWCGANDTSLVLVLDDSIDLICINYIWGEGERMKNIQEERLNNSDSIDGL